MGFDINKNEIFSSLGAARELIETRKLNPYLLIDDNALEDFDDLINLNEKPNAVVVGLAPTKFNYEELNKSFRYLFFNRLFLLYLILIKKIN